MGKLLDIIIHKYSCIVMKLNMIGRGSSKESDHLPFTRWRHGQFKLSLI